MYYFDNTMLLIIPVLLFTMWAQWNVTTTYGKYSKVASSSTGYDSARSILDANGLYDVRIEQIKGDLTDHYDPRDNVIRLSETVYGVSSAAAVGVAAHEAGHAVQHAVGYGPMKLRSAIIPITNIGSNIAMPLFLLGIIMSYRPLLIAGIAAFGISVLFQLVTLPVEFNASNRAMEALSSSGRYSDEELKAARKVLSAAAMTYIGAMAMALANLLRLVIIAGRRSNRR